MGTEEIYTSNMTVLKERFSEIAEYFEKHSFDSAFLFVEEFEGQKKLIAKYGDSYLQLDSLYDSSILSNIWVKSQMRKGCNNGPLILFGLGSGAFVRKYLETAQTDAKVFVFEPSLELFGYVISEYDLRDILCDDRIKIFVNEISKDKLSYSFRLSMTYYESLNLVKCCLPNYDVLFLNEYNYFLNEIKMACMGLQGDMSFYINLGKKINENTFSNFKYYLKSKSLRALKECMPNDFPAIIVAGGPSLDKNIKELANALKKAFIIATDTALLPMSKVGIVPDIAISSDAIKGEKYFSSDMCCEVPLVCGLNSAVEIMNLHRGIKLFVNDIQKFVQDFLDEVKVDIPIMVTGGSVANDAISLARYLGAGRIILVGQDLAYTDEKTHSSETVEGKMEIDPNGIKNTVWDVDIYGKPVRTSAQFIVYRDWIEHMIKVDDGKIKYIDATEGGMRIRGSCVEDLNEAIDKECDVEYDFSSCFKTVDDLFNDEQKKLFMYYIGGLPRAIQEIDSLAAKAIDVYDEMKLLILRDETASDKMKSLVNQSKTLLDRISNMSVIDYVKNITQKKDNEIVRKMNDAKSDEKQSLILACQAGRESMINIREAAKELIVETGKILT